MVSVIWNTGDLSSSLQVSFDKHDYLLTRDDCFALLQARAQLRFHSNALYLVSSRQRIRTCKINNFCLRWGSTYPNASSLLLLAFN